MKRRDFLMTSCAAGVAAAALTQGTANAHDTSGGKKLIEWQVYSCKTAEKKMQLIKVLDEALIPALNRQKIKPVGVFETSPELNEGDKSYNSANDLNVFVLFQFASQEELIQMTPKLLADKEYMAAASPIFSAPMNDPIYETCESTLMLGFDHCPAIEVPVKSATRLFQIRFYNSYNIERNARKIDMFDIGGELSLFRKCGMTPVFFGETLAGRMMPNLTYMLGFENTTEKDANWKKFVESAEWKTLDADPLYKDTANKIVNIFLKPTSGSQI